MLVVKSLLTIMFIQRSSCIDRWPVVNGKSICLSIRWYTHFVIHYVNWYYGENDLLIYQRMYFITNLAAAVLANHSPRTCIYVSTWNLPDWLESIYGKDIVLAIILMNDAINCMCIWPLAWCIKYKPYTIH